MLIVPGYIDVLDNDNKLLLKSQLYGNIVELNEKRYIEEFRKIQKRGVEEDNTELVRFLHDQEMLATREEIYKNIDLLYKKLDNYLHITIMPTEKCNFKCTYCYENFKEGKMSRGLIEEIKKFIYTEVSENSYEDLCIAWFGGEPTLCPDIVLDLNQYAKNLCERYGITFNSSMTTNGYLLNSTALVRFYNVGVTTYQLTVDGVRHDQNRPLLNGQKTLGKILNNLEEIKDLAQSINFKIIIRYNILEEKEDLSWYDRLSDIFSGDKRFSILLRIVKDFGGERIKKMEILERHLHQSIIEEHSQYARSKGLIIENDLIGKPFSAICYAALRNSYIFRSNGKIVKCSLHLESKRNIVGHAHQGVYIDENKNFQWHQGRVRDKCLQCSYLLACLNKNCPRKLGLGECLNGEIRKKDFY